jgi:hypothetical protein
MASEVYSVTDDRFNEWISDWFAGKHVLIPESLKLAFGTEEWCDTTYNTHYGCLNACYNCYAWKDLWRRKQRGYDLYGYNDQHEYQMVLRDKWFKTWKDRKKKYVIMYPSVHDVIPETKREAFAIMKSMLSAKNIHVLWVTKPRYEVVRDFIKEFEDYKNRITIRLTITTNDDEQLEFWEPNASGFDERDLTLEYLYDAGFNVGVSVEPMLLPKRECFATPSLAAEVDFINGLLHYVRDTLWVGLMNHFPAKSQRGIPLTEEQRDHITKLKTFYTDELIKNLVRTFYRDPKVRWKESVKKRMIILIRKSQSV